MLKLQTKGFARNMKEKLRYTFEVQHRDKIEQFKLGDEFIGKTQDFEVFLRDEERNGFEINQKFDVQAKEPI